MTTLLLRLQGPMQAWGTQSRFRERDAGSEPSKSGVVGLLCAALGKPREERAGDGMPRLAELAALRMGVRVDRAGVPRADFHTAGGTHGSDPREARYGVAKAGGGAPDTVISRRFYLADASFLVGLSGERGLLERLEAALARPAWQLCLGRKSFVPAVPVRLPAQPPLGPGLREEPLLDALKGYPLPEFRQDSARSPLRLVYDAAGEAGETAEPSKSRAEVRQDVPLDFAKRQFGLRRVQVELLSQPDTQALEPEEELEEEE